MTRVLHIGNNLSLPVDAVTRRTGILGMSGSGKTTTSRRLIEEMLRLGLACCIIDPKDDFWGLRASADGKSEGYPITVLGGEHGDAPLEQTAGKLIADMVVDEAPQLVLSMAHFSKSAMRRFVTDFAEQLYHRNREAMHLVVDEADLFAPQKLGKGDALRLFGAIDDLVRRGRKRGIGVTMICQRSAIINKDILTQCELLIAHRASHQLDQEPVTAWMRAAQMPPEKLKEVDETIATLNDGEAWVMSPQWLKRFDRVQMDLPTTFDSSATPEVGKRRIEPRALAKIDLDALSKRMAETIERAKESDPRALRQRVAELQAQLQRSGGQWEAVAKEAMDELEHVKKTKAAPAPKVEHVKVPMLTGAEIGRIEKSAWKLDAAATKLETLAGKLREDRKEIFAKIEARPRAPALQPMPPRAPAPIPVVRHAAGALADGAPGGVDTSVGNSGLRRMLIALAQRPKGLTRAQLGVRAGISSQSGTFKTYLGKARSNGWLEGKEDLRILPAGIAALGNYEPLPEGRALADYWLGELGDSGGARMLRALLDAYPNAVSRDDLGGLANISSQSGTFKTYLGRLRSLELVIGKSELRASEELFA